MYNILGDLGAVKNLPEFDFEGTLSTLNNLIDVISESDYVITRNNMKFIVVEYNAKF